MMGGLWVVGAKIKDQQGLIKDRVREGERYSEKIYNGGDSILCGNPLGNWGDKQEVIH